MSPPTIPPPQPTINPANAADVRYRVGRFTANERVIEEMAPRHNGSVRLVREALGVWESRDELDHGRHSIQGRRADAARKSGSEGDARRFAQAIVKVLRSIVHRWPTPLLRAGGARRNMSTAPTARKCAFFRRSRMT
jgi:hypothetical protein